MSTYYVSVLTKNDEKLQTAKFSEWELAKYVVLEILGIVGQEEIDDDNLVEALRIAHLGFNLETVSQEGIDHILTESSDATYWSVIGTGKHMTGILIHKILNEKCELIIDHSNCTKGNCVCS